MSDALVLVADGQIMGEIRQDERGRLTLVYDRAWRGLAQAWPLSLSLPLVVTEHEHGRVLPWLRGLLPDDPTVLERWGQQFNVSPSDPFALLGSVGEDCAGAVQLVRPHRIAAVLDAKPMTVDWLTRNTMADRLRGLRRDRAAWRLPRDAGQCSLAGATPKTALFFNGQHWGLPSGRTPTTHILKLPADPAAGVVQNAYLCLALARILGLPTARAAVVRFEDHVALAVERYDRVR
ncbi:MAG TPA: HipA N-terminal domain-containing protein, partial [Vineibacter sp.]|nr:HipA N-terminal domain-containing protein [Vineibacter sp.]